MPKVSCQNDVSRAHYQIADAVGVRKYSTGAWNLKRWTIMAGWLETERGFVQFGRTDQGATAL